jgi:phenylalanyl-tRNA synthetase beta chain
MKFSERWLRTMVDPALDSASLCERLTMAGLEVESSGPAAPPFTGVIVGRIDRVEAHPGADRLRVCTVDVGTGAALRIVCGAPNAAPGMKAPCATVGAELPGGLRIAAATMRGVDSQGMLCSAAELGIDADAAGLLALPDDAPVGANVREVLQLDDALIEVKVTPNRADCLSMQGIARDVAAVTGAPFVPPPSTIASVTSRATREVRVEDPIACPRFVSRVIEGIDARAPTPGWMKQRLERSGIRSISAVVDVTNYVMLELGQPLHAYDDRLLDGAISYGSRVPAKRSRFSTSRSSRWSPTSCSSLTRRSRWALPASWAANIPASATTRPTCCSKARSGIRPSSRADRDAWASRATQATGSSAVSTSTAARVPSSARRR